VFDLLLGNISFLVWWMVMGNVLGGDHSDFYLVYCYLMVCDLVFKIYLYGKGV